MEKIYSKIKPDLLLHIIHRKEDFCSERVDLVPADQFIQAAALNLPQGKTFKAHKHIKKPPYPYERRAQESWVCISGKIKCMFYDIDDTLIAEPILNAGDCSITLRGGHTYIALENSQAIEMKVGPYEGQEKDKTFI